MQRHKEKTNFQHIASLPNHCVVACKKSTPARMPLTTSCRLKLAIALFSAGILHQVTILAPRKAPAPTLIPPQVLMFCSTKPICFNRFTAMKLLLFSVLMGLSVSGFAFAPYTADGDPTPIRETIFYAKNGNPDWLVIRENVQISATDLIRQHLGDLGLSDQDELLLYRTDTDPLGFTHYRYQQYHRGVEVDGAELLIHEKDGFVRSLNGKLVRGLDANPQSRLTSADAIGAALKYVGGTQYMWEVPAAEAMLKRIKNNPAATYYPQPELVLMTPGFSQGPALFQPAWRMNVYAQQPLSRKEIYVDALTGNILQATEMLHDQNTPGTAETRYSGTHEIITDSVEAGVFRLVESTRGGGIETYNMQTGTDYGNAIDFLDDDNLWNNVNPKQDEVATDAHWGAEMTYDYYNIKHSRSGIDGNNMPLISYVHFDVGYNNAFWNGEFASFGDGSGAWTSLTSLDVVGHEFTHGVTGTSAGLRYQNESGALNESFSDIFGTAIEFWADPDQGDWLVGEDFVKFGSPLRSMSNPKAEDNPDTYKGQHWESSSADNGGVHTNSGVQNHWFYLLSAGGSGTNDRQNDYDVTGIGIDDAGAIAYRNLTFYLVQLSNYADAREGSLQAAEDLFGACSPAYVQTANAWYAVGVGDQLKDYDLRMVQILDPAPKSCGLTDAEFISVEFRYLGCNADLQAGDKIPMAYQINDHATVWDTLTLSNAVTGGDIVYYTFTKPASEFAVPGTYTLKCWAGFNGDLEPANNFITTKIESIFNQNVDMGLKTVVNLSGGCFLGSQTPGVSIGFYGCDFLPEGEDLALSYRVDGGSVVNASVKVPKTLYRGDTFDYIFTQPANFASKGTHIVDVWLKYGPDYLAGNDSLKGVRIVNPLPMFKEDILTFEAGIGSLDSIYSVNARETQTFLSSGAARTGALGFEMTGGDLEQAYKNGEVREPTNDNVWNNNTNRILRSKACICADLTNLSAAELRFDRKQTYSYFFYNTVGYNLPYASSLRVLANGKSISPTYKPITHNVDAWKTQKIDLKDYLGINVEICFEAHAGLSPALDTQGIGDRVLLDNITIVGQTATGTSNIGTPTPDWTVMPNPGSGLFNIAYESPDAHTLLIDVIDAYGRMIYSKTTVVGSGNNLIPLPLEGVAAGVYFVRLSSELGKSTGKIVVE